MASTSALRLLVCRSAVRMAVAAAARPSVFTSMTAVNACPRPAQIAASRLITTSAVRLGRRALTEDEAKEVMDKTTEIVKKFQGVDPEKVRLEPTILFSKFIIFLLS